MTISRERGVKAYRLMHNPETMNFEINASGRVKGRLALG